MSTHYLILTCFTRIADVLVVVSFLYVFEIIGLALAIIAALLSILLRIPRVKHDVKTYHGGSWKTWIQSYFKGWKS